MARRLGRVLYTGEFYRTVTRNVVLWCSACGVQQSENFHTKGSRLTAGRPAECSPLEVISGIQLCLPLWGGSAVEHGCSSINFVTCRYGKVLSAHVARGLVGSEKFPRVRRIRRSSDKLRCEGSTSDITFV